MVHYFFDDHNRFVIQGYTDVSPFSSFLPGIAGPLGIPMWVFYVNRGQAIAGFGVESKDAAIMEFLPANKAYQSVSHTGFRTFIRRDGAFYEPFSPRSRGDRSMFIGANELELQEISPEYHLRVNVLYFTLTGEPFAGLVRQVTVTNTATVPVDLAVLDGLPVIVPYGVENWMVKDLARTAEAWMGVFNLEQRIPFYRVRSSIVDRVEVQRVEAGHFYATFTRRERLPALVDPLVVFGQNTSLSQPDRFLDHSPGELYKDEQIVVGKTPCGFFGTAETLPPGGSLTLYGIIGHASSPALLVQESARISRPAYVEDQRRAANALVDELTDTVAIKTSEPLLDAYTRQTFLDNVMRGGWPVLLGDVVQHIYSRKHGDPERDYNAFYLAPEFYSQGNGNYRDVNQNRREDVWLNPRVGDYDVVTFMNLIQTDGYNPLVIQGNRFSIPADKRGAVLDLVDDPAVLEPLLSRSFTPGALLKHLAVTGLKTRVPPDEFLHRALREAEVSFEAVFGEGYWTDHWTYNLDLIENYLGIYPDRKSDLLFGGPVYTFYDSAALVRPRFEKYVLAGGRVKQVNAIYEDEAKAALIVARSSAPHVVRAQYGQGEIVRTTLFTRLVCLAVIKCATMDPLGMGIEMEAGKPAWYDALNGLPALFGASMPETYELARLVVFLRDAVAEQGAPARIDLPVEVYDLLQALLTALDAHHAASDSGKDHTYWDSVATAREAFRERTRLGLDGAVIPVSPGDLDAALARLQDKIQAGIDRALDLNGGILPTYFIYHAEAYERLDDQDHVRVTRFRPEVLPLFLEGPARALKIMPDRDRARALHTRVRSSDLFDRVLNMYKVNASLEGQPLDIGRARAFTPGWLENESIWLHMEYKYLLALLKAGLVEEFYDDFRHVLIPFQDPAVYGRSPLENSSFIASSAHPDRSVHGRGFVARLSGSTAEFLSILHRIMFGEQPFYMADGQLHLAFKPALPGWLFDANDTVTCTFLGSTRVIYHNPARLDTFGQASVTHITLETPEGGRVEIDGAVIGGPYAQDVRGGHYKAVRVRIGL